MFVFRIPIIYLWKVPGTPRLPSAGLSNSLAQALGTPVAEGYVEAVGRKPVMLTYNLTSSIPAMFLSPPTPVLFY